MAQRLRHPGEVDPLQRPALRLISGGGPGSGDETRSASAPSLTLTDDGHVNASGLPQQETDIRAQLDTSLGTPGRSLKQVCGDNGRPDKLLKLEYAGITESADSMTFDTPVLTKDETVWVLDSSGKTVRAVHYDVNGTGLGMPCQ